MIECETRRGFHASLGRGDPCTQCKRRCGTSSLLEDNGAEVLFSVRDTSPFRGRVSSSVMSTSWRSLLLAAELTRESLRESFRLAVEETSAVASAVAVPGDPLGIEAITKKGEILTVHVDSLYADASRTAPEERERLLSQFLTGTIDGAEAESGVRGPSLDLLIPTIKSAEWFQRLPERDHASEHLVGDLYVVYAFDEPSSMRFARWTELDRFGRSRSEPRQIALTNLRARLPSKIGTHGEDKSFLLVADGNHEASLILLDEIWERLESSIPRSIIVCVLARDVCLVTATGVPGGLESLVAARDRCFASRPSNFISKILLQRRGKSWIPYREPS